MLVFEIHFYNINTVLFAWIISIYCVRRHMIKNLGSRNDRWLEQICNIPSVIFGLFNSVYLLDLHFLLWFLCIPMFNILIGMWKWAINFVLFIKHILQINDSICEAVHSKCRTKYSRRNYFGDILIISVANIIWNHCCRMLWNKILIFFFKFYYL